MRKCIVSVFIIILVIAAALAPSGCEEYIDLAVVEEDIYFELDLFQTQVSGIPVFLFLTENSYAVIKKDGTFKLHLKPIDLNALLFLVPTDQMDIRPTMEDWVKVMMPGVDLSDLETTFRILQTTLGLKLVNVDSNDVQTQEMYAYIEETGKLPEGFFLPQNFALEINANYYMKSITSITNTVYTGVYVGNHSEKSEPYFVLTLTVDEESGKKKLIYRNEMINFDLIIIEKD